MRYKILRIAFLCVFWSNLVFSTSAKQTEIELERGIWKFTPRPARPSQSLPATVTLEEGSVTTVIRQIIDTLLSSYPSMAQLGVNETQRSERKKAINDLRLELPSLEKIKKEVNKQLNAIAIEVNTNSKTAKYYLDTNEITFGQLCNQILDILTSMNYAKVLNRRR